MNHRHLEYCPGMPAEEIPSAAIVDILQRGDLADWKPIADAVAHDPNGELAEKVLRLVDVYPTYGTSVLWRAWIDRCRVRAEGCTRAIPVEKLAVLRRSCGLTQTEIAGRIGMSQSDVSKFERRRNVHLSTLRTYAAALGGRLRILFERDGKQTEIRLRDERV